MKQFIENNAVIITIVLSGITLLVTVVGGALVYSAHSAWAARSERIAFLEDQNKILREAEDWKLPQTLESLNEVSERVRLQLEERQELESLSAENEALRSENAKYEAQIATLEKQVSSLETELQQSIETADTIELSEGQSADLIKNRVTMGVSYIGSDSVDINLDNEPQVLEIGNSMEFAYADRECTIKLTRIMVDTSPSKASFSFGCTE